VIGVNETVMGLKYSEMFELIFMAVEIQGNTFLNSTSDEDLKASSQLTNQTSIAIIAYEKYCKKIFHFN
jgi:hypothetical protein